MSLKGKDTKVDDAKEVQKIKKYVKDVTKVFFAGTVSMTLLSTASTALINKALGKNLPEKSKNI